jgi:hypothetical protein
MIQALQACVLYLLFPRLCLGLFMFKAFSLEASKMLVLGAFAPIPKGSNVNSPACNAGIPMKPLSKPEGLEFDLEPSRTLWRSFSPNLMTLILKSSNPQILTSSNPKSHPLGIFR